jgi:hypothetical protein
MKRATGQGRYDGCDVCGWEPARQNCDRFHVERTVFVVDQEVGEAAIVAL